MLLRSSWAIKIQLGTEKECYFARADSLDDMVYGSFVTHKTNKASLANPLVNLEVYEPDDTLLYQLEKQTEYTFEFPAQKIGLYK